MSDSTRVPSGRKPHVVRDHYADKRRFFAAIFWPTYRPQAAPPMVTHYRLRKAVTKAQARALVLEHYPNATIAMLVAE